MPVPNESINRSGINCSLGEFDDDLRPVLSSVSGSQRVITPLRSSSLYRSSSASRNTSATKVRNLFKAVNDLEASSRAPPRSTSRFDFV